MDALWTRINTLLLLIGVLMLGALIAMVATRAEGGELDPTDPPGSTMKPLDQVEARTPISSLPFTINASGSYYLTGDLTGVAGQHGITVAPLGGKDVTIDLNGFTLGGVPGSLDGINAAANLDRLVIINGIVRSWGGNGITGDSSASTIIHDVIVELNGGEGIDVGTGVVTNCVLRENGGFGLRAQSVQVANCRSLFNAVSGFSLGLGSVITNSSAESNGGDGIAVDAGSVVNGCAALNNSGDGIRVSADSLVTGNSLRFNGSGASDGAGIHATGTSNHIEGNVVRGNDRGIDVDSADNVIIGNTASGNTTNLSVVAGNALGPTITDATVGTATNPYGNFVP